MGVGVGRVAGVRPVSDADEDDSEAENREGNMEGQKCRIPIGPVEVAGDEIRLPGILLALV